MAEAWDDWLLDLNWAWSDWTGFRVKLRRQADWARLFAEASKLVSCHSTRDISGKGWANKSECEEFLCNKSMWYDRIFFCPYVSSTFVFGILGENRECELLASDRHPLPSSSYWKPVSLLSTFHTSRSRESIFERIGSFFSCIFIDWSRLRVTVVYDAAILNIA